MESLVEDILDLSRIEFNNFELHYSWFNIRDVIEEVFSMVNY